MQKLLVISIFFSLFSCAKANIEYNYPQNSDDYVKNRAGRYFSKEVILYQDGEKNAKKTNPQSENKLFSSAVKVISQEILLQSVDENLGIITSHWKIDPIKHKKTRIITFIEGKEALRKNIDIVIYHKSLQSNGKWQNAKLENKEKLITELKDQIIKNIK